MTTVFSMKQKRESEFCLIDRFFCGKFLLAYCKIKNDFRTFALANTEDVAQLVRALVCGTRGRGFETHLSP
jgi:hypothetical protein